MSVRNGDTLPIAAKLIPTPTRTISIADEISHIEKTANQTNVQSKTPRALPHRPRTPEFEIGETSRFEEAAYIVKHVTENKVNDGARWLRIPTRPCISNISFRNFRVDDTVEVFFKEPPSGYARILEIEQGAKEHWAVIQWPYDTEEAEASGISISQAVKWLFEMYVSSNHFQVIPEGSLERKSTCEVDQNWHFDPQNSLKLKSLPELQGQIDLQLQSNGHGWF